MLLSPDERQRRIERTLRLQQEYYQEVGEDREAEPKPKDWATSYCGDPVGFLGELIGEEWFGPEWQAWRAFVATVFVQPLRTAGEWHAFRHCTQLPQPPRQRPTQVWLPVGRRGGKSRMLAALAVYLGTAYDWTEHLDGGELGVLPILAQDRRSAATIMNYIRSFLEHPRLQPLVVKPQIESIELAGQILIEVVTANFRAIRNRTVVAALLDEVAFWPSDAESANPDREILTALEPAMATIPNALILGASSPYARRGVLWDNYERYFGQPDETHLVWKASTRVMNPSVPQAFLDEKYSEDPLSAAAEYGAEFRTDVDAFVTREVLDAATMTGIFEIPPAYGVSYKAFCDPSGGASDSMTLAVGHVDRHERRAVLDCLREVRPPFSPDTVVAEFCALLKTYKVNRVEGDHYAGEWPKDRFRQYGINYTITKKNKSDIYLEFLPMLNSNRVDLLDDRRMYYQFLNLERRTSRGGKESIDHQPGGHDDIANVTAGVTCLLIGKRDPTVIDPDVLARSAMLRAPHTYRLGTPYDPRWG